MATRNREDEESRRVSGGRIGEKKLTCWDDHIELKNKIEPDNSSKVVEGVDLHRLDAIRQMMIEDLPDKDGIFNAASIVRIHGKLLEREQENNHLLRTIVVVVLFLILSAVFNYGMFVSAVDVFKSTTVSSNNILLKYRDETKIVSTAKATTNLPIAFIPLAGLNVVNNIRHVGFTILDSVFTNKFFEPGFASKTLVGMDISGYVYFNETTALMLGENNEKLLIDYGHVFVWDFDGLVPGELAAVCPGILESSKGICSLVETSDVNLNDIFAKAQVVYFMHCSFAYAIELISDICCWGLTGLRIDIIPAIDR